MRIARKGHDQYGRQARKQNRIRKLAAKNPQKHASKRLLIISLLVVLLSSLIASLVQNSGGRVRVQDIKIPTHNGQWVVADLYKPRTATSKTPAPLVVVIPGFQRSKEALANISIELSRRGIVVILIDPYAQGFSSASMSRRAATTEGYGMFAVVDYSYDTSNLNYVDKSRIAATGHSAGGNAAIRGAVYFGKEAIRTGQQSKLHSVFVSGYVLTLTDKVLKDVRSNVGMSYALYDEGAYRNELQHGDMRKAPEALRLVNHGLAAHGEHVSEVNLGHYYGNKEDRSLRVVHNERILHPFQPYITEATANQIEFFEHVFDLNSALSSDDQVWYWKELLGLIALIAALVAVVPMGQLLLETPYFKPLVHPIPPALPRPRGRARLIFWGMFLAGALIACFTYIPMAELSKKIFVAASTRQQTWFFPQRMNNAVMLWAVLNGSVGFLMFWLSYRFFGKKNGVLPSVWGAQTSRPELWRTFVLALSLFLFYFLTLFVIYYFLHVDYRFLAMYLPFFFIFLLSNSLRINGAMRFEGESEWKSMMVGGFANSLGLMLIVVIQYLTFATTGTVYWTDGWLYVNLLFGVVPMMFVLPYFNRYFFRMTGRIYLGPMVTGLIFIMILITNTVIYIPL